MTRITLQLPDQLAREIEAVCAEEQRGPDELAADLLRRGLAVRAFRQLRNRAQAELGDHAPETDEQAMNMIR
jgi:metal-responsive CopG/Arc/MetJ family transcriptional regulator